MNWEQRGTCVSVKECVMRNSGLSENELLNPTPVSPDALQNLRAAEEIIRQSVKDGKPVSVMGDYDVDGVTSSAILFFTLQRMGVVPYIRLPKRMSEGYGLNVKAIDEFPNDSLLITVDNGISAIDAVAEAKKRGITVVILDHHLPGSALPDADVIVDPHIDPEHNGFADYCGAGLAFKLAQMLFPGDEDFLALLEPLACIGSICDSVPLVSDNRVIVKRGLATLSAQSARGNQRPAILPGLAALLDVADVYSVDETDVGFKIGPMLNAAGRLVDDGAMISFNTLAADTYSAGKEFAEKLNTLNEQRKALSAELEGKVKQIIEEECLHYSKPMIVCIDDAPEGIIGILTGRIAEEYKTPAFILTHSSTNHDVWKGSGRSYGGFNLMEAVNAAMPYLRSGGGHAGAAGISVEDANICSMITAMNKAMEGYEQPDEATTLYDLRIGSEQLSEAYAEVRKYAPYGQGVPKPTFLVEDVLLSPRGGDTAKFMGKNMEHVKLHGNKFSAVCFGQAERYKNMGCPTCLDLVGVISMNVFRFSSELQIDVADFAEHKRSGGRPTSLMEALRKNGTI